MDVFMYAGYARRTSIVKECVIGDTETVSPTMGQKISCMGDEWWGPAWVDASYGVCHTFNPCAGIPMGESCDADSDCTHILFYYKHARTALSLTLSLSLSLSVSLSLSLAPEWCLPMSRR